MRICETIGFSDPFLLMRQMNKKTFYMWCEYFNMKDRGDILDRQEYYFAEILQVMTTYASQGEIKPKLKDCLIQFKVENIKSNEDLEDEHRAREEQIFGKIKSFGKNRKQISKNKMKKKL